jgi:hypothetical protein
MRTLPSIVPLASRSLVAHLLLVCLCLGLAAGLVGLPAVAAPSATAGLTDDPEDLRRQVLEHRFAEAEAKARLYEDLRQAAQLRTPNQDEFDVLHYDLDLDIDPGTQTLSGTVTTTAQVVGTSISTMDLDLLDNMAVSSATCGGSATTFSHGNDIVTVDLDRIYVNGETVVVAVTYAGNPAAAGSNFEWREHDGRELIVTHSLFHGARLWWPCKNYLTDKADSVDIRATVPDTLVVASNGALVSNVDNGTTRTFHFCTNYSIVPHVVSLAIYPYFTYSDWYTPQGGGGPMEVQFYVFPDSVDIVQTNYAKTVPMIDTFAQGFGEYPFVSEKYGHVMWDLDFSLENQTIASLGGWSEDLIAHELAHQWFGDMITCSSFHHIWLSEGFATWAEAYWREQTSGFEDYKQYMEFATYSGPGTIYVEDPTVFGDVWDVDLSYHKASWVIHMLRGVLGDADFFAGLELYGSTHGYSTTTTEQFRDVMETVSGQDLDAFFQQWIYGEYFPIYRYEWTPVEGGVEVVIEQVQTNTGLFTMPIDVRVETTTGTFDFVVQNSLALESYELTVSGDVQDVILDPDRWILRQLEPVVTNPTFAEGILVVNGVDWDAYPWLWGAYADSAFWGDNPISFWDTFSEPAEGYPPNLPAPLGFDAVPPGTMGRFSTVIWVGNNYGGDLLDWFDSPIDSYLEVGGNVLLMTRMGSRFLDESLVSRLGITWTEIDATLGNCTAVYHRPELGNIPFTQLQSLNDTFSMIVGPNSTLLYRDTSGVDRGTGVHAFSPGGGTMRPEGGQFIYLAGRPYRMQHLGLRTNIEFLLSWFFDGGAVGIGPGISTTPARLELAANRPNPFRGNTLIPFSLPSEGTVELAIYDLRGRLVRTLVSGPRPVGSQAVSWDGRNGQGDRVASGVYYVRLLEGDRVLSRPVVLLR